MASHDPCNQVETNKDCDESRKRDRSRKESNASDTKSEGDANSPEHKKGRNDQYERMAIFETVNEQLAIVYGTEALSKLSSETDHYGIKKLIDCYNPICDGDIELMKKHMLDISGFGEDNVFIFKLAIKFVADDDTEIDETDIGELAEILLAAIRTRMTKYCNDCKNWYIVGRENRPKMFCTWCKVGMHDCLDACNDEKRQGIKWFCSECDEQFTKQIASQINKFRNIIFKGFEENEIHIKNSIIIKKKIEDIRRGTEKVEEVIDLEEDEETKQTKEKERKDQEEESKQEKKKVINKDKTNDKETKKCWFWLNKKCKNGEKCKYDHPTHCKDMIDTGICKDSKCKLAHPKICRSLFFEGYCSRRNCWYVHPTKITNRYVFRDNNNYHQIPNTFNNDINQQGWMNRNSEQDNQGNQRYNYEQNQNNNHRNGYTNNDRFLGEWPTPWETSRPMKMMIGKMFEEMTARIMNM